MCCFGSPREQTDNLFACYTRALSSVVSSYLRMQILVCLRRSVSDRNSACCTSVSPPFWSAAGSADESPLPADAGNGKLALTPVCLVVANREAVCWFQMRGCTGGAGGRWAALIKENESNNCVWDRCFATGVGTPARAGAVRVIAAAGDFYGVWFFYLRFTVPGSC